MASRRSPLRSALLVVAAGSGAAVLCWGAYALAAWLGYGRLFVDRSPDALLDRFMPQYDVAERHEIRVPANADVAYRAACGVDFERSPVIRGLFRGRELMMRAPSAPAATHEPFLRQAVRMGWRVLAERPGRELVMGAVTQPWESHVTFRAVAPEAFARFDEPGYVKIAWTIGAEPSGENASVVRTMTRVQTTDASAQRRFRVYWAVFSPGIVLIRHEALRLIRDDALHGAIANDGACASPSTGGFARR